MLAQNKAIPSALEEYLQEYKKEISNLHVLFDVKQEVVRGLIKKRFEPPQITYDKFIRTIDNAEKLFKTQEEAALNIINLAAEDTQRVRDEINNKIEAMKTIINQIEDLTNELVINISSDDESSEEVKNLLEDMENLTESVKDY
jgi:predicted RND superfamily exporter protein